MCLNFNVTINVGELLKKKEEVIDKCTKDRLLLTYFLVLKFVENQYKP